jgi:hypothetical protein
MNIPHAGAVTKHSKKPTETNSTKVVILGHVQKAVTEETSKIQPPPSKESIN